MSWSGLAAAVERHTRSPAWITATVTAVAGHLVIGALALSFAKSLEPADDAAGALVLEMAPAETSVEPTDQNVALGVPATDSAVSVPQTAQETPPPQEKPVPQLPSAADGDVEQHRTEVEERKDEREDVAPSPNPSEAPADLSVASQAAAPQAIAAPIAEKSAAPAIGNSQRAQQAKLTWHKSIMAHLNRHKRFPAEEKGPGGKVTVSFLLDRSGRVLSANLEGSSGSAALDAEATAMLHRASPLPRPSADVTGETFTLTLPIAFRKQ